jgi:predicted amidohydrolase YtcJ
MVLLNAKVFTSDTARPYVEALAIRGERIAAVGQTKEIAALAGKATKRVDLGGRTVIPGINDAHVHLRAGPDSYELQFGDLDPDWQQVKQPFLPRS